MCFQKKHIKLNSGTNKTTLASHEFLVQSSGVPELLRQRSLVLSGWVVTSGSTLVLPFWLKHSKISSPTWALALCASKESVKIGQNGQQLRMRYWSLSAGFKKLIMVFRRIYAIYLEEYMLFN